MVTTNLASRLAPDRLTRLALLERDLNAGCDYPESLGYWLQVVEACELKRAMADLADELERASRAETPSGEPNTDVMLAALRGVRDAIVDLNEREGR